MRALCLILVSGLAGCVTQKPPTPNLQTEAVAPRPATAPAIVTRYELGEYRYPRSSFGEQETAIYRRTRIGSPAIGNKVESSFEISLYSRPSYTPLPPSVELSAELAVQREVSKELAAIRDSVVAMEENMRGQYGALVTRTEEVSQIREQLEAERARVREIEAQLLQQQSNPPANPPTPSLVSPVRQEAVKW